ncbi:MAG: hypothetical protein H6657_24835 [Ardenticatenaceae bacterium]|nr:hypothetical protein [Anaerolineales bacterium]MCB8980649.1 hypothetical protein [Ardenticatenaceae bacterium]
MNPKKQTSEQFPITNKTRHATVRAFLFSQNESGQKIFGGTSIPQQSLALFDPPAQQTHRTIDKVFGCHSVNHVGSCGFPTMGFVAGAQGAIRGAKQRLWDRSFCRSKLRQQGSPTIFAGQARPTISPRPTRRKQCMGVTTKHSQRSPLPAFPYFQRGSHAR